MVVVVVGVVSRSDIDIRIGVGVARELIVLVRLGDNFGVVVVGARTKLRPF